MDGGTAAGQVQQQTQLNRGRREYEVRRPTDGEARDFTRQGGTTQRREFNRQFGEVDRGQRSRYEGDQFRQRTGDQQATNGERRDFRDRDRDFRDRDRDFSDRDFRNRDRDFANNYEQWRRNAGGERDRGRDFRDWSGNWRDGNRFDVANRVRNRWRGRDWNDFPFILGWWGGSNWYGPRWAFWDSYARNRPFYWWAWAGAPRLTSWLTYSWPTPYYWDYGQGEYIYYDDGAVYVNGRWYEPAPVFYRDTVRIVESAPELSAEEAAQKEWLPLGVFAVTPEGMADADVLVQLAVTQDGILSGTAYDQQSSAAYHVEGKVDQQSQRAVWSYTDQRGQRVVMESSIYNLTQPEATGLVQYGPNNMQVIELVKLQPPEQASVAGAGAATTR